MGPEPFLCRIRILINLRYCEKATKFGKKIHFMFEITWWEIFSIFCGLLRIYELYPNNFSNYSQEFLLKKFGLIVEKGGRNARCIFGSWFLQLFMSSSRDISGQPALGPVKALNKIVRFGYKNTFLCIPLISQFKVGTLSSTYFKLAVS